MEFLKKLSAKHYYLLVVLLLASFLRLYNVSNTVQFLGDQGRDALIVSRIFTELDPVFIGPVTSVGNMYLGPLYYYFMVPFLFLTYPSPMGPVYAVALLGILTVYLMYEIGKRFLPEKTALGAAGLYGLSAVIAYNTRFSWNPNPAPLVSLFMLLFTYKAVKENERNWIWVVVCLAVLIQLHYMTLLSGAGFGLIWIYQLVVKLKQKQSIKALLTNTLIAAVVFLLSLTPLALFDLKHDGLNRKAFVNILTKEESFSPEKPKDGLAIYGYLADLRNRTELVLTQVTIGEKRDLVAFPLSAGIVVVLSLIVYRQYVNRKKSKKKIWVTGEFVILSFLLTGIFGTTAYQHNIYYHYIAYLFPVGIFATAIVMRKLFNNSNVGKLIVLVYLVLFLQFNYQHAQVILKSLGWTIANIQSVAKTMEDRVQEGEKYNIVLLNGTGDIYGQNYRYFLTASEKPPLKEEAFGETETLFIIDEERKYEKVTNSPVYEIVVFPDKEPQEVYQIPDGPEITVLRKDAQ